MQCLTPAWPKFLQLAEINQMMVMEELNTRSGPKLDWEVVDEGIKVVNVKFYGRNAAIVKRYGTTSDATLDIKEEFWGRVTQALISIKDDTEILLMEDLNLKT